MANFKKFRLKRILVNSLPAFLVAGLVLSANLYFDLDLGRVVMNEITRITQNLEVLTGQIIGANNEQLLLGTTNDLVEVVRGGQTYLVCDASGNCAGSFGYAFASGTTNYLTKFTSASSLGNSIVLDNGNLVSILGQLSSQGTTTLATSSGNVGIGTTTPLAKLHLINGTFLIDNPLNPIRVGNVDTGYTISLYVSDKYAFVAAGYSNLHIVDISRPSNPTIISTYATSGYGLAVRVSGQYAYLANESGYFQIIDISNPSNPTWVATYNPGHTTRDVYLSGKYAFVLAGAKVFVVDISNPKNPNLVGSYDFVSPVPRDIYVSGKYAFVAQETAGLAILDISDPTNPTHIQTYNTTGTAYGVYVSGRYAYVADGEAGLQIIDISNPANPTWVGNYNTPGSCGKVFVSGKYAFVADGAYGLQIIDVSNPANPTLVGNYNTPGSAYDVYVSGRYAYVADYDAGLQIIDIFGIDTHAANIGNIFSQNLTVSENVDIANNLYVRNGLNVGVGGIYSQGPISILSSTSSNTVSAFDVKNSAGTPLFYVRNDGNIGIGTTTPSSKLTVSGDLFVSSTSTLANVLPLADNLYNLGSPSLRWANIFAVTTTIGNTITIGSNTFEGSATTTLFTTGNSNQLVLGANGNVGIGTTAPEAKLHIRSDTNSPLEVLIRNDNLGSSADARLTISTGWGGATADPILQFAIPGVRDWIIGIDNADGDKFKIARDFTNNFNNTAIAIDILNNVGIGTTGPTEKLTISGGNISLTTPNSKIIGNTGLTLEENGDIYGTVRLHLQNRTGVNGAMFEQAGTADLVDFVFKSLSNQRNIRLEDRNGFVFAGDPEFQIGIAGNPTLVIGDNVSAFRNGNVGIGTTTPSSKLTVSGDLFVSSTSTLANVLPLADNLYNLGSPTLRWANIFAVTTTIGNTITIGSNTFEGSATTTLFTTGNSNQLVLGANGNVGIGTTAPWAKLEVVDYQSDGYLSSSNSVGSPYGSKVIIKNAQNTTNTSAFIQFQALEGTGTNNIWYVGIGGSAPSFGGPLVIGRRTGFTAYGEVMRITSTGNVGIGTTAPQAKLHIFNSGGGTNEQNIAWFAADGDGYDRIKLLITPGGTSNSYWYAERWRHNWHWDRNSSNGRVRQMRLDSSGKLDLYNPTPSMDDVRISLNPVGNSFFIGGNVGIGTTNPGSEYKLDVNGNIAVNSSIYFDTGDYLFYDRNNNQYNFRIGHATYVNWNSSYMNFGYVPVFTVYDSGGVFIGNNPSNPGLGNLVVTGSVGIGTTSFSSKLAVSGLTSSQPGRYICSDANGNFYYHTTACVSSSFKFKKDIKDLDLGLDALMNLRPVTFKFNESYGGDDQTTHMGFIAEEVEKITPLLVDYTDGQPTGVRYSEMTALLVKSIQEQQKQIEKMQLAIDEEGDLTYGGKKIVSSENQSLFEAIKKLIKQALSEIEKLFVKEINIERAEIEEAEIKKAIVNQICLRGEDGEEICLTKDQLKSLINNSFTSQNNNQVSETDNETNNKTVCLPIWQCTDWQPPAEEICANEIFLQERTCTDLNNCATQEGKPIESQQAVGTKDCQNEK